MEAYLGKLLAVLYVALGLGFVIFIHELGHFLLAKWSGVKVLRFSIGFGPVLVSYRKGIGLRFGSSTRRYEALVQAEREGTIPASAPELGETEYVLSVLPLGGFVHMLGEGPQDPASERSTDPRAYHNKSVGARMLIISAGVLMNLIFGLVCASALYLGKTVEIAPRIGAVDAGQVAYEAGIRPGDEIVAVDGRAGVSFDDLRRLIAFSGAGQALRLDIRRAGQEELLHLTVSPYRTAHYDIPTIGIGPSPSLALSTLQPFSLPPGMEGAPKGPDGGFQPGDTVIALGPAGETPTPVASPEELNRLLSRYANRPIDVVVERAAKDRDKGKGVAKGPTPKQATITVPVNHFVDFGLRLAIEPIVAIRPDSPAAKAGFREGDRIVKVDGREDFDPMRLPDECFWKAGEPLTFEVERRTAGGVIETITLTATPDDTPIWAEPVYRDEPLEVPGLGLAYGIAPKIVAIRPGSPAAKSRLKVGDVIRSLTYTQSVPGQKEGEKVTLAFDKQRASWAYAFDQLQNEPKQAVLLSVANSETPVTITPAPVADWFNPRRGLEFQVWTRELPPQDPIAAAQRGLRDTWDSVLSIYATISGLVQGRIGKDAVGGPIKIADFAYGAARLGWKSFLPFLGMLSINLAVINFLPIPPLDGGQFLLLLFEVVRGRPLPERWQLAFLAAGIAFVLGLLLFVSVNDIWSYFRPAG
ncbi:MAG: site-2 protease family protein [Isosphaeraceae bacterium]|nr:site-2 protease family protein [Isosphaeraceae bacterium]